MQPDAPVAIGVNVDDLRPMENRQAEGGLLGMLYSEEIC
jgi:hypothetical protein